MAPASPSHIVLVLIKYLIENGGKFLLANLHCCYFASEFILSSGKE